MACTCTEDKFLQISDGEIPWDGVTGGCIIGRNRVMCQECIDQNAKQEIERKKQEIKARLAQLDLALIRPLSEGEQDRVNAIIAEKEELRKCLS